MAVVRAVSSCCFAEVLGEVLLPLFFRPVRLPAIRANSSGHGGSTGGFVLLLCGSARRSSPTTFLSARAPCRRSVPDSSGHGGSTGGFVLFRLRKCWDKFPTALFLVSARKVLTPIDLRHRQKLHTAGGYLRYMDCGAVDFVSTLHPRNLRGNCNGPYLSPVPANPTAPRPSLAPRTRSPPDDPRGCELPRRLGRPNSRAVAKRGKIRPQICQSGGQWCATENPIWMLGLPAARHPPAPPGSNRPPGEPDRQGGHMSTSGMTIDEACDPDG